jgi:hypothetical protein
VREGKRRANLGGGHQAVAHNALTPVTPLSVADFERLTDRTVSRVIVGDKRAQQVHGGSAGLDP